MSLASTTGTYMAMIDPTIWDQTRKPLLPNLTVRDISDTPQSPQRSLASNTISIHTYTSNPASMEQTRELYIIFLIYFAYFLSDPTETVLSKTRTINYSSVL